MSTEAKEPSAKGHYLVSPAWDLAFIINAPWLLFAAAAILFLHGLAPDVNEFRHYFVTLPHRFVTFALVFLDRDQFARRPRAFVGYMVAFLALVLAAGALGSGQIWGMNAFLCVFAVDYTWNAYHFAAQHFGITRIYGNKAGSARPRLERWVLIPAVTYALLTTANWTVAEGALGVVFTVLDIAAVTGLVALVVLEVAGGIRSLPKLLYLASVALLYGGILVLPYVGLTQLRFGLLASAGFFHSVEYLAIVTYYVNGKNASGGFKGAMRYTAGRFAPMLVAFCLGVGLLGVVGHTGAPQLYIIVLAVGSFCHYAYDGMIWKLRKPAVSQALRAEALP